MGKNIYDLQSAEWEKTVEMHCLLKDGPTKVYNLVKAGYGVYPEILTLMFSLGYVAEVENVLSVAKKYNANALHDWLVAYYGENEWKQNVAAFKLEWVALHYFSPEECAKAGFWKALELKKDWTSKALLAEKFGMKHLFQICDKLRAQTKDSTSTQAEELLHDMESYLVYKGEFTYLYEHKSWNALHGNMAAFKYLFEIEDFDAVMNCVVSGMKPETKSFVRQTLQEAKLDTRQKERFQLLCYRDLL